MALPAINMSLSQLRVGDAEPAPTSMDQEGMEHLPRFVQGMEFLPKGGRSVMSDSESEDDAEEHDYHDWEPGYGSPDGRKRSELPRSRSDRADAPSDSLPTPLPIPPPPVPLDPPQQRNAIAKRMMLTDSQYARGLGIVSGEMGFWRVQLAWNDVDDERVWRQEQMLKKFMVQWPQSPPETQPWLMAFQGPLQRAVHDLRAMRASGKFDDFWENPVTMLRAAGTEEGNALADRYLRDFPEEEVEWLGQILDELTTDMSGGPSGASLPQTDAEVRRNWASKQFMTFHGLLMRLYTVFRNAITFYPPTSAMHKKAVQLATHTAYRFTQYHLDEWEMSVAARVDEIDVHVPGSMRPIKARYRIPKALRVRFFCTEVRDCPYAAFFRARTQFPPLSAPGARGALQAAADALGVPTPDDFRDA